MTSMIKIKKILTDLKLENNFI